MTMIDPLLSQIRSSFRPIPETRGEAALYNHSHRGRGNADCLMVLFVGLTRETQAPIGTNSVAVAPHVTVRTTEQGVQIANSSAKAHHPKYQRAGLPLPDEQDQSSKTRVHERPGGSSHF